MSAIQRAFEKFHAANPAVFSELVAISRSYAQRGYKKIGIGHLAEIVRWQRNMTTTGDDFKINNNFRSRYARLIVAKYPEFATLFRMRELRS